MKTIILTPEQDRQNEAVFSLFDLDNEFENVASLFTGFISNITSLFNGDSPDLSYSAEQALAIAFGMEMAQMRVDARCLKLKGSFDSSCYDFSFVGCLMTLHRFEDWVRTFDVELSKLIMCLIDVLTGSSKDLSMALKQALFIELRGSEADK